MKKTLLYLAGAAALLAGCAKEVAVEDPTPAPGVKTITIQASIDPETKTNVEIDGTTGIYSWNANETIGVIEAPDDQEMLGKVVTFTVSDVENGLFTGTLSEGFSLAGAVSPWYFVEGAAYREGKLMYNITLDGFYDYDNGTNAVLVAGEPTASGDLQKFSFKHAAALFMVTYENVPVGTKRLSITTDKPLTGEFDFGSFEDVEIKSGSAIGTTEKTIYVTLSSAVTEANQTLTFYAPIPTGEYGSVSVSLQDESGATIDGTTKSKTKAFTAKRGGILALPTITLTPAPEEKYYVKVTSDEELMNDGQYLIVYEMGFFGVAFDGSLATLDVANNTIDVEISEDDKILSTEETDASSFIISIEEGSILSQSGLYIGVTSNSNGLKQSKTSDYEHVISIDGEGNASIVVSGVSDGMALRYNTASNQARFRYYKNAGQQPVALYLLEGSGTPAKASPELSFGTAEYEITFGDDFEAPALENPHDVSVTYSSSNAEVASVDGNTGEVEILGIGTTTVSAEFEGDDTYRAQTVSYKITVMAPPTKVSDVIAGGAGNYTLEGVTVYAVAGANYIIGDETGKMVLYKGSLSLKAGDVINVSGPVVVYNDILEFSGSSDNPVNVENTGETVTVDHGTASQPTASVLSVFNEGNHSAMYVQGAGTQSGRNITVGDVTLYLNVANAATDNSAVVFSGYVVAYSSTHGTYTFQAVDLSVDESVAALKVMPKTLSWEAAAFGSGSAKTVSVSLNGDASGYKVEFADPDNAWYVNDDEEGTITVYPLAANESKDDKKTLEIMVTHLDDASLTETVTLSQAVASGETGEKTLTIDFESDANTYTSWVFNTITTKQTNSNVPAHGGSYYGGTDGKASGSVTTASAIQTPKSIVFYISKESTNTTASSWIIQVSSDGSSWTDVLTESASAGLTRGEWKEVSQDLSSYSNVYVRIAYSGTTAKRCIDDVVLTYAE